MKNIFTLLVAMLGVSPIFAQVEVGVKAVIVRNNASVTYVDSYNSKTKSIPFAQGICAEGMYNLKYWRIGISATYQQDKCTFTQRIPVGCFGSEVVNTTISEKLVPLQLLASRKFYFHNLEAYGGVAAGVIRGYGKVTNVNLEAAATTSKTNSNGFTTGAHAGLTWHVTKHIGLNAEVAANYMKISGTYLHYDLVSYPISMGVRYRF